MKTIAEVIAESQAKVMQDLASKKLGNNKPEADEPKGLISQAVKDATQQINPKNGTIK